MMFLVFEEKAVVRKSGVGIDCCVRAILSNTYFASVDRKAVLTQKEA